MNNQERITDRFTRNAEDFDRIVIDTFKIIEEKDARIVELEEENKKLCEVVEAAKKFISNGKTRNIFNLEEALNTLEDK